MYCVWAFHLVTHPIQACDKIKVYREGAGTDECLHEGGSVWLVLKLIK